LGLVELIIRIFFFLSKKNSPAIIKINKFLVLLYDNIHHQL
jgi:hypothetical protein